MSIHTIAEKIKPHRRIFLFIALLLGASIASFYLGYIARAEKASNTGVTINCPAEAYMGTKSASNSSIGPVGGGETGAIVASRNGTKYYYPNCSGVTRIKEENKVWFQTKEEAEAAGYSLAANCSL